MPARDSINADALAQVAKRLFGPNPDPMPSIDVLKWHGLEGYWAGSGHRNVTPELNAARANIALHHRLQMQAALDVIDTLATMQIEAVLFKGGALSHQIYSPGERPHCDIDVLIGESDRDLAIELITSLGFEQNLSLAGGELMHQLLFRRWIGEAVQRIDLHWRFSNRPVLNQSLTFERILAHSVKLAVGDEMTIRAPSAEAALLLACAHLAGHHHDETPRLIWLIDIARLWRVSDQARVLALAKEWQLAGLLAYGLDLAQRYAPENMGELPLRELKRIGVDEPATTLLSGGNPWRDMTLDLSALPGFYRKINYLSDMTWPSAHYMRARYGLTSRWQLPAAHVRRWWSGLRRVLSKGGPTRPLGE